jgi:hypothetical protein
MFIGTGEQSLANRVAKVNCTAVTEIREFEWLEVNTAHDGFTL